MSRPSGCLLALCAAASSCIAPPAPLALPPAPIEVLYERRDGAVAEESSPQRLHIQVLALRGPVPGTSVDAAALRIASEHGEPFRGASPLPPGSRWLVGEPARQWLAAEEQQAPDRRQDLGAAEVVLAPGLRALVRAPSTALPRLLLEPGAEPAVPLALSAQPIDAMGRLSDIHLQAPLGDGPVLLFVAATRPDEVGFAWILGPCEPASADAAGAAAAAAAPASPPPPPPEQVPTAWRVAMAAVGQHNRRPALLAIAQPLHLPRCIDVLLVADERALADITQALAPLPYDEAARGWPFERALWTALLPRIERDDLPSSMHAALLRHLGALAIDSGSLRTVLTSAADGAAFEALLQEENLAALDDHETAMRVRGHDWLAARGTAVAGYSPFARPEARREALRRHAEASLRQEGAR